MPETAVGEPKVWDEARVWDELKVWDKVWDQAA